MEVLKKIIAVIGTVLAFIGKIPAFFLPNSLKGYRTEFFNILALIAGFLQTFDIIPISESICGLFNCDPTIIQSIFVAIVTLVNINLRHQTDTEVHTK